MLVGLALIDALTAQEPDPKALIEGLYREGGVRAEALAPDLRDAATGCAAYEAWVRPEGALTDLRINELNRSGASRSWVLATFSSEGLRMARRYELVLQDGAWVITDAVGDRGQVTLKQEIETCSATSS